MMVPEKKFLFLKKFILLFIIIFIIFSVPIHATPSGKEIAKDVPQEEVIPEANPDQTHAEAEEHSSDMSPLFFLIVALIIGAGTRHFLKKSPLPYTVSLLVIGLILGAFTRLGYFGEWNLLLFQLDTSFMGKAVGWAGHIDPHLIMYVFLPTLIFEAAFAMDVHTFKKSFTNAFILAVPGIMTAIFLTALVVMVIQLLGIGLASWSWMIALLFGTVISATDPVAVVALLKELGASKKLGTLIEGESLLNDGTAIVIFMVILLSITGAGSEASPVVEFLRVSVGGTLVGLVIGYIIIAWVKKVFNDALVEITVIIAAAYITFYIAEHFFHVSGVLGLVALGLLMASTGRTRISPEVEHFLHEFWEMFAFIANTLIFLIVGVVIANNIVFTANDFFILILLYFGIHLVRAVVITLFFPVMKVAGYGLTKKNAYVLWWGALRGAIGLALALIVASESKIDSSIRDQFLFYTAGIVTMTLLINATTIKLLLNSLGLTRIPPAKQKMILNARNYLRQASEKSIDKLKTDRFLSRANWQNVEDFLPEQPQTEEIVLDEGEKANLYETRRRVLEKEKSSYWTQFKEGLLGPIAVRNLADAINEIIDADGKIPLSDRKDLEKMWETPKFLSKLQSIPLLNKISQSFFFDRLANSYDAARGFVEAQYETLKLVESMAISSNTEELTIDQDLATVESEINENRIHGLTFIRNLKNTYPEIYNAIATRQAIRSNLNNELKVVDRLLKKGQIGSDEARKMIDSIEERMKKLVDRPPEIKPPEKAKLLQEIPWLKELDKNLFNKIVSLFQHRNYAVGEKIVKEHGHVDGLYVIARGTVKVTINNRLVDILGKGSIFGEIAVLTNIPRTATVTAESPVTVFRLTSVSMQQVIHDNHTLEDKLWEIAAPRLAENILTRHEDYKKLNHSEIQLWLKKGEIIIAKKVRNLELAGKIGILITGKAMRENNETVEAPCLIDDQTLTLSRESRILLCKKPD
ncbi:MAG: cation:proton antiporter [Bacteroidales bacterium]|jgi:NhaP-type Na+/H+ or K+/H+ antiporter/CRP-like cAMP-binding protein|nr:cation:proton antiporter [Bacteroidales bacterium]